MTRAVPSLRVGTTTVRESAVNGFALYTTADRDATVCTMTKVSQFASLLGSRATVGLVSSHEATDHYVSHWIPPVGCLSPVPSGSFRPGYSHSPSTFPLK